jgi:hypothetical protein
MVVIGGSGSYTDKFVIGNVKLMLFGSGALTGITKSMVGFIKCR